MSTTIPETSARQSYLKLKPILDKLEDLHGLRFSPEEATGRGLWMTQFAKQDKARLKALYKQAPVSIIDELESRALAVKGASLEVSAVVEELSSDELFQARKQRDELLLQIQAVCFGDAEIQKELARIRSGRGHRDLGNDLLDVATLVTQKKVWSKMKSAGFLSEKGLEDLQDKGARILRWTGRSSDPLTQNPREAERRAWSYLVEGYNLVRDYTRVLYREEPELWEYRYPSIYSTRSPKKEAASPAPTTPTP